MADMQTPLRKVRGLGAAREGTGHFWRVRVTSIALIVLSLYFLGFVISLNGTDYATVRAALAQPFATLMMGLFVLVGLVHMRLGMQEIIEDYIHAEGQKLVLLILSAFFCVAVGVASIFALLKLTLGG
ncbi:succinate dehydrogenase, hydrophobic membrane anchor protein [Mesorhizobium koreense]|uniref:succinate dehydrogenase, hydrophobic membrane anchor protein n=1 Tax=Mesorhizobium koreense TaxID=3074855 RepID=UPI00287B6198|nr:succinate dehydrogenase, hydrophobic membrane anchor protein [Mesorhizobium sp. WR6]